MPPTDPAEPAPTEPVRVDRRRQRTRNALLDAGRELFATQSVDGVTIDDIVAAADVAKGSFYNHFPDKDALARALAEEARASAEALAARTVVGVTDPAERVARALCGFARQALDAPIATRASLRLFQGASIPDATMNAGVRADVAAGIAAGRFSGLTQEAGLLMTVGVVQIAIGRVLTHPDPRKAQGLSRELAFGLLRGLGLEPLTAKAIATKAAADIFTGPPLAD